MYDKRVRRRRAVLAATVAASLILLTVYFGESATGGLHSVQRGALQVLGPIQEGASRVLKPFRDLFNWVGDTVDAKQERDEIAKERDALEKRVTELEAAATENEQLRAMLEINQASLDRYEPVQARVTARSPNLFYSTLTIDKGSKDVKVDDPVVAANGALVGRVTSVTRGYSIVTLITDREFAVAARTLSRRGNRVGPSLQGAVQPQVGSRGDLIFDVLDDPREVREGDRVVTAGSLRSDLKSYYPPNITIGKVSRVELGEGDLDREIHVRPSADLRGLIWVEVLTRTEPEQLQADAGSP